MRKIFPAGMGLVPCLVHLRVAQTEVGGKIHDLHARIVQIRTDFHGHAVGHGKKDHVAVFGKSLHFRLNERHVRARKPLKKGIHGVEPPTGVLPGSGGGQPDGRMGGQNTGQFHPGVTGYADQSGSQHGSSP